MWKQTKFWIILFAALFVAGCGAFLLLRGSGQSGSVAEIRVDGELYESIDLAAVTAPYDIEIRTQYGTNTVRVEHGAISVTAADCRDHLCVEQGRMTSTAIPIVCLPHRLTIRIGGGA